jgi:putative CocE/NonD family hydrolase
MAPVRIYVMGEHTWRNEQEWPLARTRYTPYYLDSSGHANTLHGDGRLGTAPPADTASDTYVYDPRDPVPSAGGAMLGPRSGIARQNEVERRDDVLVYTSPILKWDVEVTGPVKLVLLVSTTAPSTDFTAKLADVYPDGTAYNVSEGILRRAYEGTAGPVEVTDCRLTRAGLTGHFGRIRREGSRTRRIGAGERVALESKKMELTTNLSVQSERHDAIGS